MSATLKELEAMKAVAEAIEPLEDAARARVLRWVSDHFKVKHVSRNEAERVLEVAGDPTSQPTAPTFESVGELFAAAAPSSDAEKALVAGYWLQVEKGQVGFGTQEINTELKHLGYGIGNITRAFDALKKTKPQQVIQLRKAGTTKQARKTFKLTEAGIRAVESMARNLAN